MKKIFIFLTAAMFMCSFSVFARGGGRAGGGAGIGGGMGSGTMSQSRIHNQYKTGNAYNGTIRQGTPKQTRSQASSEKGTTISKGSGDNLQTKDRKRDGSCDDQ